MRVLIVGAGAVGQTYGYHLREGGAAVTFMVKERYAAEARAGYRLWRLRWGRKPAERQLHDIGVVTRVEEVAAQTFDQVWLCVASTALRRPWLAELIGVIGDATIVALQPGLDDRALILQHADEARLVQGVITWIAYQAPLPDDRVPGEGVAFWLPPMSACPFAGPEERARAVVDTLRAGGMRAKVQADAATRAAVLSAAMMPHLVALEVERWSLDRLARGALIDVAAGASREAMDVVASETGRKRPWWSSRVRPGLIRTLIRVARWVIPLPLQTYLAYHFTKVGAQTRLMVRAYIMKGRARGLATQHLERLAAEGAFPVD